MATIANLLVRLGADFGDTESKMHGVADAAQHMEDSADHAGQKIDDLGEHAKHGGESSGEMGEMLKKLGEQLLEVALEVAEVASVMEVLKESMEVYAEIESVSVALTHFTGSLEATDKAMREFEEIAKSEALKFPEVLPAAQHFMALGFSVKQTVEAIKVAGNASWALGTSVESVTQRMGMMVMGGQVSGRFLRSLGISLEDLGRVMGLTGKDTADLEDKVRRVFKFESEEERLNALTEAMGKFGDMGKSEAETLSGKWIEMKNAFHEAFASIGEDLAPIAKILVDIGTQVAHVIALLAKLPHSLRDKYKGDGDKGVPNTGDESTGWSGTDYDTGKKEAGGLKDLSGKEAAAERLAESYAAQEYTRNKTRIDSQAAAAKSMIEIWRQAAAAYTATSSMTHAEQLEADKFFNEEELKIALDAIAKKKALQTSSKGLREEDKDATLDVQAAAAKEKFARANAELDNKEMERQNKVFETAEKLGKERNKKIKEEFDKELTLDGVQITNRTRVDQDAYDKQIKMLEDWALENDKIGKEILDGERKRADEHASLVEHQAGTAARGAASGASQSNKVQQMSLEHAYAVETTHTLAQQVEYERQLGELQAKALDIKTREAQAESKAATDYAMVLQQSADILGTDEARGKAAEAINRANEAALKVTDAQAAADEARERSLNKQLELIRQQSILGQLEGHVASAGQGIPGGLGNAIAGGVMNSGKGGMDVGKQITEAMRSVGRDLFGSVITAAIKQLIVTIGANTLAQTVLHFVFGTAAAAQTVSTAANTVATAANTAVVGASSATTVALTTSNAALIIALGSLETAVWVQAGTNLLSFDTGGPVSHDMVAKIHGGEHVLTSDQVQGLAPMPDIPGLRTDSSGLRGVGRSISGNSSSSSSTVGDLHFHVNGAQNPRQAAKDIATHLKQVSPAFSPYAVPYSS